MDHMRKNWSEELENIRKGINRLDGFETTISIHYLRDRYQNEQYPDRIFDELDIVWAISNGQIVEGFDVGDKGRNPEPERTIVGPSMKGDQIVMITLMKTAKQFIIKTVFPVGSNPRYTKHLSQKEKGD